MVKRRSSFLSHRHATLDLAVSVGRSVGPNFERFLHCGPCTTVRDSVAVYPALINSHEPVQCMRIIWYQGDIFTQILTRMHLNLEIIGLSLHQSLALFNISKPAQFQAHVRQSSNVS